jgi:uncharacterized protein
MPRVKSLHIYPVKSCRGHDVATAEADRHGFIGDRRFLIVTPAGQFLTQRQIPELALVETDWSNERLTLSSPSRGSVAVETGAGPTRPEMRVQIWKDSVIAEDCGGEVAKWLTRAIGQPLRLVKIGANYHRPVKPSKAQPGDVVMFSDAYPFLLMTVASVADLNDRIQENGSDPVPMNRFRPNIVIEGTAPLEEDTWRQFRIGTLAFRNAGPCARCIVTTTDQQTAERGKEPLRTLATYRRDPKDPTDVNFGINLIHETKSGRISVGDEVTKK